MHYKCGKEGHPLRKLPELLMVFKGTEEIFSGSTLCTPFYQCYMGTWSSLSLNFSPSFLSISLPLELTSPHNSYIFTSMNLSFQTLTFVMDDVPKINQANFLLSTIYHLS